MGEEGPFGGKDKNEHFRDMLTAAKEKGFNPRLVSFDSWYTALDNLKLIRSLGWSWFARMKGNRLVDPDRKGNVNLDSIEIPREGRVVHLRGYGMVKVFKTVSTNGDVEYYATDDTKMRERECEDLSGQGWGIEEYHRGIKQCCGVERSQVREAIKQLAHLALSLGLPAPRTREDHERHKLVRVGDIRGEGAISIYLANPVLARPSA